MGYLHIDNLYKNQAVLQYEYCYALEKIHGTSAHVVWNEGKVGFFSGGENYQNFVKLFDEPALQNGFIVALGYLIPSPEKQLPKKVTVYGEAYGGKQQGMRATYGDQLRFVAFDVRLDDGTWLNVPEAEAFCVRLGIEFIHYNTIQTTMDVINAERDAPSVQAKRNGILEDKIREGVVLRPLVEAVDQYGERIISKHKRDEFKETKTSRKVIDPAQLAVLTKANEIAEEWVTLSRLEHVLDKLPKDIGLENMGDIMKAMHEDISREAKGEILESKEARKAISSRTANLFKAKLKASLLTK